MQLVLHYLPIPSSVTRRYDTTRWLITITYPSQTHPRAPASFSATPTAAMLPRTRTLLQPLRQLRPTPPPNPLAWQQCTPHQPRRAKRTCRVAQRRPTTGKNLEGVITACRMQVSNIKWHQWKVASYPLEWGQAAASSDRPFLHAARDVDRVWGAPSRRLYLRVLWVRQG